MSQMRAQPTLSAVSVAPETPWTEGALPEAIVVQTIGEECRYRASGVVIVFDKETFDVFEAECADGERVSLDRCATMFVLGHGLIGSMGHLLRSTTPQAD